MIAALLLAAVAEPQVSASAIDAERAFAADAQTIGQWTAFRKYAAKEALMFTPQPTAASVFLKDRKDPPASVFWWPGKSYVSCDGTVAVNSGPWVRGGGKSVGYFTTVWVRQADGDWKWVYDGGDELPTPRAEGGDIKAVIAKCPAPGSAVASASASDSPGRSGGGESRDGTLTWHWTVSPDGARDFVVELYDGSNFTTVLHDTIAAPR